MTFKYFSHNGNILPVEQAVIPLSNIEYSYGFGVYETIRVTNRIPYFLKDHVERLLESTHIIDLKHSYSESSVEKAIVELIEKNNVETCNLKILLIGGHIKEDASLNILALNPLFPDKKLYKNGVHCTTYRYERLFPHAKTLNMLGSYLAYRKAKEAGAYDALFLNHNGDITEGTRTNFFCIKDKRIVSPPEAEILLGVTRKVLMKIAKENGYAFEESRITLSDLKDYDGAFITSTSSKILPIRSIDSLTLCEPPLALRNLGLLFDEFLRNCKGALT